MVFHGEEDHLVPAHQIEHEIVVHYELPQIVSFVEKLAQTFGQRRRFGGFHCAGQEGSTGLREPTQRGNDVIEEAVEKPMKCHPTVRGDKFFDGSEIGREVFGETRSLTGHDAI